MDGGEERARPVSPARDESDDSEAERAGPGRAPDGGAGGPAWGRLKSKLRGVDWPLVWTVLAVKFLVLALGGVALTIWESRAPGSPLGWLEVWNRWDAVQYQIIARDGYQVSGEGRYSLAFFPLYPLLARLVAVAARDYVLSAFIVSGVASVFAALLLKRLAGMDEQEAVARRAAWFLLIFPTSYFLHIGYTESLFIALVVGCFVAARRGEWPLAGTLGLLAAMTRVNGLLLFPALLAEALGEYRATRRWRWAWLWAAASLAGFACYLWLNRRAAGDPLAFLSFQKENWSRNLAPPWTGMWNAYNLIWRKGAAEAHMVGFEELFFAALGLAGLFFCARLLRPSYTVWMALNWLLFTSTTFMISVPRYTLTLFPLYILLARLSRRGVWYEIITVWSLLSLALFAGLFASGRWAF